MPASPGPAPSTVGDAAMRHGTADTASLTTAEQAFTLLRRQSKNTHVKLRTIAQTVIQTGDLPANGRSKTR